MSSPVLVIDHSINNSIHLFCHFRGIRWQFFCWRSSSPLFSLLSILFTRILVHISSSFSFFKPNFLFHFFQIAVFNCLLIMEAEKYTEKSKHYLQFVGWTTAHKLLVIFQTIRNRHQWESIMFLVPHTKHLCFWDFIRCRAGGNRKRFLMLFSCYSLAIFHDFKQANIKLEFQI